MAHKHTYKSPNKLTQNPTPNCDNLGQTEIILHILLGRDVANVEAEPPFPFKYYYKKERCVAALSNRLLSVSKIVAYALEVFR
mgnify:CR=1